MVRWVHPHLVGPCDPGLAGDAWNDGIVSTDARGVHNETLECGADDRCTNFSPTLMAPWHAAAQGEHKYQFHMETDPADLGRQLRRFDDVGVVVDRPARFE